MLSLKNTLVKLFDFIIYGNVIIAFCAALSTLSTALLINTPLFITEQDKQLAVFVGSATFFLYNVHKPITYFLRKQFINNQRFTRTKSFERPLSILSILAAIFCCYFFFQLKPKAQLLLIGMSILSLGYVLPILGKGRRLRDIVYLKIFLIAVVWSAVTVFLPRLNIENNNINNIHLCELFIERMCFVFALCMPFDIRDMDWDTQTNVKTIPLSIGIKNAKILAISALIIAIIMGLFLKNKGVYNQLLYLKLIIVYLMTALIILKTHKNRSDYFFYGLVDGMILIQSLVVLFSF